VSVLYADGCDGYHDGVAAGGGMAGQVGGNRFSAVVGWVKTGNRDWFQFNTYGRWGGGGIMANSSTAVYYVFGGSADELIMGFHHRFLSGMGQSAVIFEFQSAIDSDRKVSFGYDSSGVRYYLRDAAGTYYYGTHTPVLYTWDFLEFRMKIGTTDGELEMRINQGPSQSATDILTTTADLLSGNSNTYIDKILMNQVARPESRFDDLHILAVDGSAPQTFLGDGRIYSLLPTADAAPNQWAPGTGPDHFDEVNSIGDDSYSHGTLEASLIGNSEVFDMENLTDPTESIDFVSTRTLLGRIDAGSAEAQVFLRQGALDTNTLTLAPGSVKGHNGGYEPLNPSTGLPWTFADINNLQSGVRVTV